MTPQHEAAIRTAVEALADAIVVAVRAEASPTSTPPDRLISVTEACHALSLGRTSLYKHLGSGPGQLRSHLVGRRRLISAGDLRRFTDEASGLPAPLKSSGGSISRREPAQPHGGLEADSRTANGGLAG